MIDVRVRNGGRGAASCVRVGLLLGAVLACACTSRDDALVPRPGSSTGGRVEPVCAAGTAGAAMPGGGVQRPLLIRHLAGETGWFAAPLVSELGEPGARKIVSAQYTLFVHDASGALLDSAPGNGRRVYAPHVVADLEGDGLHEIVLGQGPQVFAYEWSGGRLRVKAGWPVDTTTAGEAPEVRGLAAADLDGDGSIEIVATTTQTRPTESGGAQVFVLSSDGRLYQPAGTPFQAWPRYNARAGAGGDADRNGAGHHGYGCYGLNVGIGDLDGDPELEIVVTYDNHHVQAFERDGQAVDASPWFTSRQSEYLGRRMTWGQFIRWADPVVEEDHYHLHTGSWPHPTTHEWLQWTASPPSVVDLDGDGRNEVLGVPNVERGEPYRTQAYALMVLQGWHGDGSGSAMRAPGWERLPRGERPIEVSGWYPPAGVPAAATVDIQGDRRPEVVVSLNDGAMHAFDAAGQRLWRYDYTHGKSIMFASEPAVADLDQDGSPEIVFGTYGAPAVRDSGHLVVLAANGALLHDVPLPNPGEDGNGNGAPAAPTIDDLDGDGQLEILVQTFDHGIDVFTVPGSGSSCLLWTTARGGPLRTGAPSAR